jgi:hypothetical protein
MLTPSNKFFDFYNVCLKDLQIDKCRIENELRIYRSKEFSQARLILCEDYERLLDKVLMNLTVEKPEPELAIKKGLLALEQIEGFRLILANLLEGIKNYHSLHNMLIDYSDIKVSDPTLSR